MKRSICLAIAAVVLGISFQAGATILNPFQREGRVKPHTILLTGNYAKPRLLAELAQYYTKQPVLIVSPDADGSYQVYYMPNAREAKLVESEAELMDLVSSFIKPKRIIILGDADYVPESLARKLRENFSVISLDSADWSKNADSLSRILDAKQLKAKFDAHVGASTLN